MKTLNKQHTNNSLTELASTELHEVTGAQGTSFLEIDGIKGEAESTPRGLEAQGLDVVIAATTTDTATPHAISVVEGREP